MNDDQFTKLTKYLDERFDLLEKRIDFNEQHMARGFDGMNDRFDRVERRLDTLEGAVDVLAGDARDIKTELGAIGIQLDRHDSAIRQLADHTGAQLQYE